MHNELSRTFHIVDIQNLLGSPSPSAAEVRDLFRLCYLEMPGFARGDQGVASAHRGIARRVLFEVPRCFRFLVAPDGFSTADLALQQSVDVDLVSRRFGRVVIASGDRSFVDLATAFNRRGVNLTVVFGKGALSHELAHVARHVRHLRVDRLDEHEPLLAASCA